MWDREGQGLYSAVFTAVQTYINAVTLTNISNDISRLNAAITPLLELNCFTTVRSRAQIFLLCDCIDGIQ